MLKKSLFSLVVLTAAAAIVTADSPDGVEKAQRFQSPQVEPTPSALESCQAPTRSATAKVDFAELSQAQNASTQLEELGGTSSWSSSYSWTTTYYTCYCFVFPYWRKCAC